MVLVGVLVLVGVGAGQVIVLVLEKFIQSLVVRAWITLVGGNAGTTPWLSLDEMIMPDEAAAFHHQYPVLS